MDDRSEAATPRHMEKLRSKGDVAQSAELTSAVTLVLGVYLLISRLPRLVEELSYIMRHSFTSLSRQDLDMQQLSEGANGIVGVLAGDWLSLVGYMCLTGIVVGVAQTRGLISMNRLMPSFDRINPFSGLKRIFSKQGLFETAKGLIKMVILGLVLYNMIKDLPSRLALAAQSQLGVALTMVGDSLASLARTAAFLLLAAAALDYVWQFMQHRKRSKMTKQEVREDMKSSEGRPEIKAKIRQMMRRWSRQRMMQELATSNVIVTNPTHLAIALRYDRATMAAPVVVAKGKDLIAAQIVRRARELNIAIVQNIPLAHSLIKVELGAQIPVQLFQAVAEVLAFVYRLRRAGLPAPYPLDMPRGGAPGDAPAAQQESSL